MGQIIIVVTILLKFLLPFSFFKAAFIGSWLNFVLDSVDGDILMHWGVSWYDYTLIDKTADYLTYVIMFLVGRRWKVGKLITILFVFRTIGQFAFFLTQKDILLFIFPNLLEPLFMIYSAILFFKKEKAYLTYKKWMVPIWIFIITYKMWNEYNIHVGHIDLSSKYFGFSN